MKDRKYCATLKDARKHVPWRGVAVKCDINPDKFMELPGSEDAVEKIISLSEQQQYLFFSTLSRKFSSLRINFFTY